MTAQIIDFKDLQERQAKEDKKWKDAGLPTDADIAKAIEDAAEFMGWDTEDEK